MDTELVTRAQNGDREAFADLAAAIGAAPYDPRPQLDEFLDIFRFSTERRAGELQSTRASVLRRSAEGLLGARHLSFVPSGRFVQHEPP